jgi:protein-S-isoprenylcysteine O-methyltransferase Ste14
MNDLAKNTILGFGKLFLGLGVSLFAPGWNLDFWQGWVYLLVFSGAAVLITAHLWQKDPKLLERRIKVGPGAEIEKRQKLIQLLASLLFISLNVLPSFDHRFGWSNVPFPLVMTGDSLVLLGFLIIFRVFRENTFAAAIIEVVPGQKVISTGPYAIVRHPMYSGALLMILGTPLALGSWWGLLLVIPLTLIIVWRLLGEEEYLGKSLSGYQEYCRKVQNRLAPSIW